MYPMSSTPDNDGSVSVYVVLSIIAAIVCFCGVILPLMMVHYQRTDIGRPRSLIDQEAVDFIESDEA